MDVIMVPCRPHLIVIANENIIAPLFRPNDVIQLRFLAMFFISMLPVRKRILSLLITGPRRRYLAVRLLHDGIPQELFVSLWILFTTSPSQRPVNLIELLCIIAVRTHDPKFHIEITRNEKNPLHRLYVLPEEN